MVAREMPFPRHLMHSTSIEEPEDFLIKPEAQHYQDMSTATQHYEVHQHPVSLHHQPVYYELAPPGCSSTSSFVMAMDTKPSIQGHPSVAFSAHRKRKGSSYIASSEYDDDTGEDSTRTNDESKKQNHSEIEKRRRDKMNTHIMELSAMIPMCQAMSRKLDKLTVLRMAVQHLKSIRGMVPSNTEGIYKPAFLTDQELKMLILQAVDGFLFVVGCDRGKILYASESISKVLSYTQGDLLGQNWFDILHPKDVTVVKEQLTSSDASPRERLIDAKTMLPVHNADVTPDTYLCPGARRSFYCRMRCKSQVKLEDDQSWYGDRRKKQQASDRKYVVIHFTGYLKAWASSKSDISIDGENMDLENDSEQSWSSLTCLVAVGRVTTTRPTTPVVTHHRGMPPPPVRTPEFISRHTMDGKFLFVDQRATLILGFLPQELLGTSMYEYYHPDDITVLAEVHKTSLVNGEVIKTAPYRFRTKDGDYIYLQSNWKSLKNPWTKDVEYLISKNSMIVNLNENDSPTVKNVPELVQESVVNYEFFNQSSGAIDRLINTSVGSSKIGSVIAGAALEQKRRAASPPVSPDRRSASVATPPISPATNSCFKREQPRYALKHISNYQMNGSSLSKHCIIIDSLSDHVLVQPVNITQSQPLLMPSTSSLPQVRETTTAKSYWSNHLESRDVVLASAASDIKTCSDEDIMLEIISGPMASEEGAENAAESDGNGEAAVIMSLLEAESGFGGVVDFTGMAWPLT